MPLELAELFRYDAWANHRVLRSLQQPNTPSKAVGLFAHILAAQEIWLARLGGRDSSHIDVWPTRTVAECQEAQHLLERTIEEYLRTLNEGALDQPLDYSNTAGKAFRNTPRQILTHVAFHGQYHRGQIAAYLRETGATPAVTDLIAHYRET